MANGGNRPIAPVRKLIAAVLGTVATFVVLFGLGMTSWAIVALGVALLVLAVALATVRGGGRTWVVGVGHVHSASEPPTQYAFGRCELQLVIDAPGLPPRSKKIIEPRVPVAKWPSLGQTLPIRVALDDQRHVRVLWDDVPTHAETAATVVADLPPEYAGAEPLDEMLIQQEAPPWADRAPDDDYREDRRDDFRDDFRAPMGDPLGDPVGDPLGDPFGADRVSRPEEREPVVVHQRPGGPVVLEGILVEQPTTGTLPRRAAPTPRPPAEERFDTPDERLDPPAPADPLDLPLDDPAPPRVRRERISPEELDEAIFGPEPAVGSDEETGKTTAAGDEFGAPISGVGLTLLVTDLPRSLGFYRDLGFTEVDRGSGNAVLASGTTRLVLREVTEAAPISRRLVHVNLEVDNIDSAYERLRGTGVRFTYAPRVVNRGTKLEVWAAAFRDPDGHGIALTQWRERAEA
ncbi:VOC family protein [Micromonospora peucetia]|uniref:Glyoxalase-like domain-containing protein n=1 Tax=Micromonospora peucetia TaxID=47871 RepID=A0A1C6VJF0_9ACTN|nr:VOC family protein [Micromonospora peucetia]MCX4388947.1 VOC family protein [Micromonospora peucetia]WSA30443.1 VOC family protein [Micromonospora peucetia]SCL66412.1 Glyoxalase-like domain-containing protein [Micromonospora peucetia]